jgi:Leu/Phe-tRNA-protein transferase
MKPSFEIHYGDHIGGIYQRTDGHWCLHEAVVTRVVEISKSCFVYSRGFISKGKGKVSECFICTKCSAKWQSEPFYTRKHFRTLMAGRILGNVYL